MEANVVLPGGRPDGESDIRLAELTRAYEKLQQEHAHQQALIEATPDAFHIYDVATGALRRGSLSGKALIGFSAVMGEVMMGLDVERWLPAVDVARLSDFFAAGAGLADGAVAKCRHRVLDASGGVKWLSRRVTPFSRDDSGAVTELLVVSRDVTDVVLVEDQLEHAALHDELTGLANRRLARDRLEHALLRTSRGGHVAVLVCDLDGFKRVNDAYGHHVGDWVLVETAGRMSGAIRPADTIARVAREDGWPTNTIARMGGDEFIVILDIPQQDDPAAVAGQVATRIAEAIAEPYEIDGREHRMSISIGVVIAEDLSTAESLLSDADAAMYHLKARGGNGHALFEPSHRPDSAEADYLERSIRRSLAEGDIQVHYQPIVDPRTATIHGVEALLRVRDENGRFLNAADVVRVAESTGLIGEVDAQVLRLACETTARWRQNPDLANLMLKVNRSVRDITRPGFYDRVADALASSGLDPRALTLEITETVLLDASRSNLADLRALHDLGIGLGIDDFGTGYASLRYIAELPINCIKIDQSFTSRIPQDPTANALVRTTVSLAEQLDINCVVEGVETAEQLAALPAYERLLVQGYLYARARPATEVPQREWVGAARPELVV